MISIIIPTLNEANTLPIALKSIKDQNLSDVEVIVVDSASRDGTQDIALKFEAKVLEYPGKPLGARKHGLMNSSGEFVLLMDADQILRSGSLFRALEAIKGSDMIVLEERSYRPDNWVQRSLDSQKCFIQKQAGNADGIGLHIYPRFFKRDVLEKAYALIPEELLPKVFAFDDSLLYSKLRSLSSMTGTIPDAIFHIEERNAFHLITHNLRFGRNAKVMKSMIARSSFYQAKPFFEMFRDAVKHRYLLTSLLKELSYQFGYRFG
jgi:glycosyltransferase involved in cell wall biosynthesis